uniref:Uncharacterized protein n=1 Tax=Sphaerodactylus townsendi TaxID=933632 RepID=A0ACB8FT81_9SAUR
MDQRTQGSQRPIPPPPAPVAGRGFRQPKIPAHFDQGSKSFAEFAHQFRALLGKINDWPDHMFAELFYDAVNPEICRWAVINIKPQSMEEWIEKSKPTTSSAKPASRVLAAKAPKSPKTTHGSSKALVMEDSDFADEEDMDLGVGLTAAASKDAIDTPKDGLWFAVTTQSESRLQGGPPSQQSVQPPEGLASSFQKAGEQAVPLEEGEASLQLRNGLWWRTPLCPAFVV